MSICVRVCWNSKFQYVLKHILLWIHSFICSWNHIVWYGRFHCVPKYVKWETAYHLAHKSILAWLYRIVFDPSHKTCLFGRIKSFNKMLYVRLTWFSVGNSCLDFSMTSKKRIFFFCDAKVHAWQKGRHGRECCISGGVLSLCSCAAKPMLPSG